MRKIISIFITACLLSLCVLGGVITEDTKDLKTIQEFADTYMCENAGVLSEWFALALSDSGCDFSKYISSLDNYVAQSSPSGVTSLKYALVYRSLGVDNSYVQKTVQGITDNGGVMYVVFALHLLNNGLECDGVTKDSLSEKLIGMQNDDGGWSVIKGNSDVDATAMALQALACDKSKHTEAIEKAVEFLSNAQTDAGAFKSYGVENSESTAQVIIALSDLGIDCKNDERFIKNKNSAFDALKAFKKQGGYSHTADGDVSDLATSQVLCAFTAYDNFQNERSPFYIFDKKADVIPSDTLPITNAPESDEDAGDDDVIVQKSEASPSWRIIFICAIAFIFIIVCVLLAILKKATAQNIIITAVVCIIAVTASFFINLKTPDDYYTEDAQTEQVTGSVTFGINAESIGKGKIISDVKIPIYDTDTAYDVLIRAAKKYELVIGADGTGSFAYIKSINGISELQHGELSGWTYTVNGKQPSVGCGAYALQDGDSIEFIYTKEMKFE